MGFFSLRFSGLAAQHPCGLTLSCQSSVELGRMKSARPPSVPIAQEHSGTALDASLLALRV